MTNHPSTGRASRITTLLVKEHRISKLEARDLHGKHAPLPATEDIGAVHRSDWILDYRAARILKTLTGFQNRLLPNDTGACYLSGLLSR